MAQTYTSDKAVAGGYGTAGGALVGSAARVRAGQCPAPTKKHEALGVCEAVP